MTTTPNAHPGQPSLFDRAVAAREQGQFEEAAQLYAQVPPDDSHYPMALHHLGVLKYQAGDLPGALQLMQQTLRLNPQNSRAEANQANILFALGRPDEALAACDRTLAIDSQNAPAWNIKGCLLASANQHESAIKCWSRALEIEPEMAEAWVNRGMALRALGQNDRAIESLERALQLDPKNANVWFHHGEIEYALGRYGLALTSLERALEIMPEMIDAWINRGIALRVLGQNDRAIESLERAVQLAPQDANVWANRGAIEYALNQYDLALASLKQAVALGNDPFALSLLTDVSSECCDWRMCNKQLVALLQSLQEKNSGLAYKDISPFVLLRFPFSLAKLQGITELHTAGSFETLQPTTSEMRARHIGKPRPQRLRIGYFSADFHNHATMYLMAELFEAHDKARFETIGICLGRYGGQPDDAMRVRAKQAFDRFETAGDLDNDQLLRLARTLDLHIAVDLKGHTKDSRMGVFAQRTAPIQMHYLGYPGTLGMPGAIDYLVADRVLIPESSRPFYSEKIIELPDSYQVNDRQRAIDPVVPSRIELGLPENAFVFCCFNNNNKITQEVFSLWMQLLRDMPHSVLWLLASNDIAARNLKQAAQEAGINPARIIFAQRVKLPQHLARQAQADLFLDTWPCNAHTTASDALWVGLPVLTCMGETFASRVGASLLTACNLPELITSTPQDYLSRAKELAHDPQQLVAIRRKLQDTRMTVPLFDTVRFTRHLEKAYDMAWERFAQGLPPDHIIVPALPASTIPRRS